MAADKAWTRGFAVLWTQLLSLWPQHPATQLTAECYAEHLSDLPLDLLQEACRRICRQHDGYFPTVARIRDEAIEVARERERQVGMLPPPRQTVSPEQRRKYADAVKAIVQERQDDDSFEWKREIYEILGDEANPGADFLAEYQRRTGRAAYPQHADRRTGGTR